MAGKAIVVCADGLEEIEAVTPVDILRRAEVEVATVGLDCVVVTGAHGIALKMDRVLLEVEDVDAVILPGGLPGADNLSASERLISVLKAQLAAGRIVGAICAAPGLVLGKHGLLRGKRATCYPGFEEQFGADAVYLDEQVVKDGNLITSRGPGTAFAFGLALARELAGDAIANELARGMLYAK